MRGRGLSRCAKASRDSLQYQNINDARNHLVVCIGIGLSWGIISLC